MTPAKGTNSPSSRPERLSLANPPASCRIPEAAARFEPEIADIPFKGFHVGAGVNGNGRMAQDRRASVQSSPGRNLRSGPSGPSGQISSQKRGFFHEYHGDAAIRQIFGRPKTGNAAADHGGMFLHLTRIGSRGSSMLGFGSGHGYQPRGLLGCLIPVMHPTDLLADIGMFINIGVGPGPGDGGRWFRADWGRMRRRRSGRPSRFSDPP